MATTEETVRGDQFIRVPKTNLYELIWLNVQTAEPSDPQDGWIVYADGTSWDPSSGEGIYAYYNSQWNKL